MADTQQSQSLYRIVTNGSTGEIYFGSILGILSHIVLSSVSSPVEVESKRA